MSAAVVPAALADEVCVERPRSRTQLMDEPGIDQGLKLKSWKNLTR